MTVQWFPSSFGTGAHFAEKAGRVLGLVRERSDGLWRATQFNGTDGRQWAVMLAGSEAHARAWIETGAGDGDAHAGAEGATAAL